MSIFREDLEQLSEIDPYYKLTRDEVARSEFREKIEFIWKELIDKSLIGDKEEKIANEAQKNFTGVLWQLELTYILSKKHKLVKPNDSGPDIIIDNFENGQIIIECVASNVSGKNKIERTFGQPVYIDNNKNKLRVLESIFKKLENYKRWLKNQTISQNDKFIIAIDTSNLPDGDLIGYPNTNIIEMLLYGIGDLFYEVNLQNGKSAIKYKSKECIEKPNGGIVPSKLTENQDFKFVTALLWKQESFIRNHSLSGENIMQFNNNNAINLIKNDFKLLQ